VQASSKTAVKLEEMAQLLQQLALEKVRRVSGLGSYVLVQASLLGHCMLLPCWLWEVNGHGGSSQLSSLLSATPQMSGQYSGVVSFHCFSCHLGCFR
jgi:hypothetical protein